MSKIRYLITSKVVLGLLLIVTCASNAESLRVSSSVKGLHIVAIDKIPPAPLMTVTENTALNCERDPPETQEGKIITGLGWKVINEVSSGDVVAVGFFSQGEDGTSGSCFVKNGNVAIFEKGNLQALVYGDEIKDDSSSMIGVITKTNLRNTFRLREFFPGVPAVADLYYNGKVARVQPLAPLEPYCEGTAPVPNVYGKPITTARKSLINYGWKPDVSETDENDPSAKQLNKKGVTEVDTCSGTGFGFCNLYYAREGGASLRVTTMGDDFTVTNYDVDCPK